MRIHLAVVVAVAPLLAEQSDAEKRLAAAAAVLTEAMDAPDMGIPQSLMAKAHCAAVVPGLKSGAFVIGGEYGKGYLSCRDKDGKGWSAPGTIRIEGGSFGLQAGGSERDLILLVMNERGMDKLLSDKFTIGAEASVAAGPVGRTATAETDAQMQAEILSWSRTRGVFAGVSLQGATLRQDLNENEALYGAKLDNREIVTGGKSVPAAATTLISKLNQYGGRQEAGPTASQH
jgi:SH3 domain-containing YSC84-like protein 1